MPLRRRVILRRVAMAVAPATLAFLAACSMFASRDDYASYREVRLAESESRWLIAMREYVEAHPDGRWADEIRAERAELEPMFWEENRDTIGGLNDYLEAYPNGPHRAEGNERLAALHEVAASRAEEAEAARAVLEERRQELMAFRRGWLTRAARFWAATFLSVGDWGSPIADVARGNPDFNRAYGLRPPPRCSVEECLKFYRSVYQIPLPGQTAITRRVEMLLRLRLEDGNLVRAELLLPNKGFSRWYELENRTLVTDEDPEQRQVAITWALERLVPAIREAVPDVTAVDVVPEPIDPPALAASTDETDHAARAPGDEDVERELERQEQAARERLESIAEEARQAGDSSLNALVDAATGDVADPLASAEPPEPEAPVPSHAMETLVLPIALQGFETERLRVVIFGANDEDYGAAYDGVVIELR